RCTSSVPASLVFLPGFDVSIKPGAEQFFAIWWAWVNFTWFASAYDTDDTPYRLLTFVQMAGVLILAAGVQRAFDHQDWRMVFAGYLVMRVALILQWLRAANDETGPARRTAQRYAAGVGLCQVGWLALLWLPQSLRGWWYLVMAAAELAVPVIAERSRATAWNPHHIAERYGLFTIIVLGEAIAAAAVAVQSALGEHKGLRDLLLVASGGLLLVLAAWWIYFAVPIHEILATKRVAFAWGYGHYLIFGSAAAVGAGLEVAAEQAVGQAHLSTTAASAAVTIPAALFLFTTWLLHSRYHKRGLAQQSTLPVTAVLILLCTLAGHWAIPAAGLVTVAALATGATLARRTSPPMATDR
ncbi:low temperature requirement protein A, partial [Micromonospora sp. LZ34]